MAKEFRNIKMGTTETAIKLTIDVQDFLNTEGLPISSTGNTYNVASTFGGVKLEGSMEGLVLDVKVYTKKEYYDKRVEYTKQAKVAQQVMKELEANSEALGFFMKMGMTKEQAMKAAAKMVATALED
jgi:hypothetical protein